MACLSFQQSSRAKDGPPGPHSKCAVCKSYFSEHPTKIPPTRTYPRKELETLGAGAPSSAEPNPRIKGVGEILLHEIIKLVFPGGKEVQNQEELTLRLHLVVGLLYKYGYGPSAPSS
jgi:hypothetical protein